MVKYLKVGFVTYAFPKGNGAETGSTVYAKAFVKYLARRKEIEEIRVLSIGWKNYPIFETIGDKIKVYRIPCSISPKFGIDRYEYVTKSLTFAKFFKDVDIIHCEHCLEGIFGHYCKNVYGIPYILVREVVSKYLPSIYSRFFLFHIEKFLTKYLNYDILVSWSKYMVENYFLKWGINPEKMTVIPGGVDTEIFNPFVKFENIRPKYGIGEDDFFLLSVKIFSMSNTLGLLNSIKAFSKFLKYAPEAKYMIIGEGRGRFYLENLIRKLGITKNVILPGMVPVKKLINYYRSCDATVHYFSYDPSISMCMLESLACGVPIITTNVGEVPNIVNENVGILVKPNIDEMKDAMLTIYRDEKMRKKMSENACDLIKRRFDIELITYTYIDLYKEIDGKS